MTTQELKSLFEKHDDEYLKFDRIQGRTTNREDLHAFNLLDRLVPYVESTGCSDIVSCAEHDEFWLSIDTAKLADVITEEQVVELIRCGVRYDTNNGALAFFV